jgi:hypothetical protein
VIKVKGKIAKTKALHLSFFMEFQNRTRYTIAG